MTVRLCVALRGIVAESGPSGYGKLSPQAGWKAYVLLHVTLCKLGAVL